MMTTEKLTSENPKSTREARARRLESLRGLTRLSRVEFAKRCGVKPGSFQNWEGPRFGGLTEKAAQKIIRGARALGIDCSLEWLMHGIGQGPQVDERNYLGENTLTVRQTPETYNANQLVESESITQELLLFRQHHKDTLDFVAHDDGMEPIIKKDDYVAGIPRYYQDIENIIGQTCIVKTASGETLIRVVKKGLTPGYYNLFCVNFNSSVLKPVLYDVELVCAAPIIWIRRHNNSSAILS